jgi:predicted dehydrogenase
VGRLGFVDDRLDNFHADVYLKLLRGDLAGLGYEVAGCTALQPDPSRTWAEVNGVPWFDDVASLDAVVDAYVVLAPSTPETHLPLCTQVLPCGKPTYVDKTFAPDLATAEAIFDLADEHGVAMQTTSALRYTQVQAYVRDVGAAGVRHIVAWGGGSSFVEYAIHPVELVVSCLGPAVSRLQRWGGEPRSRLLLEWDHGATGIVHVHTDGGVPSAAAVTTTAETRYIEVDSATIFRDTARAFVELFASGRPNVPRAESLAVRRILDGAGKPEARDGFIEF